MTWHTRAKWMQRPSQRLFLRPRRTSVSARPSKVRAPAALVVSSRMHGKAIRIIGIDPGLRRTGWGIVEADGVRLVYVASGLVTSDAEVDLAYRLRQLYEG